MKGKKEKIEVLTLKNLSKSSQNLIKGGDGILNLTSSTKVKILGATGLMVPYGHTSPTPYN